MPEPTYTTPNGTVYIAGGKDANCTLSVCPVSASVYGYRPSIEASSILIGIFSLCMVAQVYLGRRYRQWGFTSAICLGCVDEIIGYLGRILLYNNPWNNAGFIMQIGKSRISFRSNRVSVLTLSSLHHDRACLLLGRHLLFAAPNVSLRGHDCNHSEADSELAVWCIYPASPHVSNQDGSTTSSFPATSSASYYRPLAVLCLQPPTAVRMSVSTLHWQAWAFKWLRWQSFRP